MESYDKFKQVQADIARSRITLLTQKETYSKQAEIFRHEIQAGGLMGDDDRVDTAMAGLKTTNEKLALIDHQLNQSLETLALKVFLEGEAVLTKLANELSKQYDLILEARKGYIEQIRKLAVIRQRSVDVYNQTGEVGPVVRKNALGPLQIRGFNEFTVDLRLLQSLLK